MNRMIISWLSVVLLTLLVACGQSVAPTYETVSPAEIKPGDAIPSPTDTAVLTISGAIITKNDGETLNFDMDTLEKVGLVKYTVSDPWLNTKVTYSGVLLADLLKVAGVSETATTINVQALDGYAADIPLTETQQWPVLVATQADGAYISIENNGPTRIIFPYDNYSDLANARNMSVWNIKSLEIK